MPTMKHTNPLASKLRSARLRAGLSQEGLSRTSGLSTSIIVKLEGKAARRPRIDTLDAWAKGCGITRNELLTKRARANT